MAHPPRLASAGLVFAACCLLLLQASHTVKSACITGCHGMHSDQSYKEGQTYLYTLEGSSVSSVSEGQGEATLKLKADVELDVKPDCTRQLKLKNVQVNGAAVPQQDLEKYALQFNYHHGHIDTELCAETGDSEASLNIKRAVISLFQSSVFQDEGSTSRHEVDILGGCVTDFTFSKDGDVQVVKKVRNLNQCSNRENIKQGLISGIINPVAGFQSTPLIGAHQKIEQRFKNGVLDKAVSTETYKLRPFSNGEAGAKTVVETTLTSKGTKAGGSTAAVSVPKSLIFEVPHPAAKSSVEAIEKALQPVHKDGDEPVRPEEARRFSQLVRVLRTSNKKDILTVYNHIKSGAGFDKVRDKKMLLDALYRTGTGDAAEVVVELIKNKEISNLQALLYYASLVFVQRVNLPAVAAVTTLLDQPNLSRIGYLGIGQIIGRYCAYNSCENVPEIKSALEKIVAKVKDGKADKRSDEDVIIAALKGLGNAKYLDDATLTKLANIAADKKIHNRVRVAAIEALPTKCSKVWKDVIAKTFADQDEDSEIRIKAYLSLVACPCNWVANIVKDVLEKEKTYQVGSFITSHLRNLRASADPFKQDAKAYLGQIKPRTKFPEDFRKFSFNNEFSYSLDSFGIGSTAESNVIYSQNSFVPRSANLNLTTEIFGHSFNFLELEARTENLDRVFEHFFGPKGIINTQKAEAATKEQYSKLKGLGRYIQDRFEKISRSKREVKPADVDKFSKSVQLRNNEVDEELDLDLSIKLFGVELAFLSYEGSSSAYTPQQIVDKIFDQFNEGVSKIKDLHYDMENHIYFLDAEFIYPTALGVSLNFGVSGSSVVRAKTNTKIDLPAIFSNAKNADVKIAVEPSASVEIVGELVVDDGFGVESGIKVVSTLHTSTGYDLNVKVLDGKGIDVSLGVPKKKQEIISVTSDVLYKNGKSDYVPIKFGKGIERSDCFDQFTDPLGLAVCGHVSYPYDNLVALQKRPLYPLSGPSKFSLTVENNDVSSYHFKAFYNDKNPKDRSFEILIETPNSKVSRYASVILQAAVEPDPKVKLSFDSPVKKASAEAIVKRSAQEHTVTFTVKNDQVDYFARAGVESLGGNKYKPILEYKVPEHIEKLTGAKKGGKDQAAQVKGTVEVADHNGGKKYVFNDVQLVANDVKLFGIDGTAALSPEAVELDVNLGTQIQDLGLKVNAKKLGPKHYSVAASANPSKNAANAIGFEWEYNHQKGLFDHKLALTQGADLKSDNNRLQLVQHAEYNPEPAQFSFSSKNKLTYPKVGLVARLDGDLTKKSLNAESELKYDKFKFGADVSGKVNTNKQGDYEIKFNGAVADNKVNVETKRTIIDDSKSKFENVLKFTPGGTYQADATLQWQVKKNDVNVGVDAEINFNGKKAKVDTGLEVNPDKLNNYVQAIANGVKYVDYSLKIQRTPNPNGNLVLNIKSYIVANGQFNYQSGKGNGAINVEIPKINRKIKGSGDVSVTGSKHVANFELNYDADKDPNKKLKVGTVTDLTKNSIDSKNVVEILTYKTELNFKGKHDGGFLTGKQEGEVEMTLPNGRYVTFKGNREAEKKDDAQSVKGHFELADYVTKGADGRKLIYDSNGNIVSIKKGLFDSVVEVKYVHKDGKDVSVKVGQKHLAQPNSEKKNAELHGTVSGSLIKDPLALDTVLTYDLDGAVFKGSASRGSDVAIKGDVNFERGNVIDKPTKLKGSVEAKFPSDKLKNIKFDFDNSAVRKKSANEEFDLKNEASLTYNNDKNMKFNQEYKYSIGPDAKKIDQSYTATIKVLDKPPVTVNAKHDLDYTGDLKKIHHAGNVKFGEKEYSGDVLVSVKMNKLAVKGKFMSPHEKLKNIDLDYNYEKQDLKYKTDMVLNVDGAKYTHSTEIDSGDAPGVHVLHAGPEGKSDYKLITPKGFVVMDGKVKLESVDDFVINVNFDSDKVQYRKIKAELANKPNAQEGRKIFITVTSEGKNLVTGSTNYKRHEEDKKITVEGNGSLKIGEDTKGSSFKYVRKQLTRESDKEVGVATMLNASFGPSAIVVELKLSNKEVRVFNSYCEASKDCAHFKLQSTLDTDNVPNMNHNLQVEVNLKKFNVPVEFGLQSTTKYADQSVDHQANLYLHSSKDRTQYTYHVYSNKRESAVVLALPSRELAVVAFHDFPVFTSSGSYKIDVSLYLDRKNKPNDKTSLLVTGDVNVDKNALGVSGEAKFTYPNQPKDFIVKGKMNVGGEQIFGANVDIDLFKTKTDKITADVKLVKREIPKGYNTTSSLNVYSKGQLIDVKSNGHVAVATGLVDLGHVFSYTDVILKPQNFGAYFSATPEKVDVHVFMPTKDVIKSHTTINVGKDLQKIDSELSVLERDPVVAVVELKDYNSFKFDYGKKGDAKNRVMANGKVVMGQLAEIHADALKDGAKQELFHLLIHLDDSKFLKPDFAINRKNIHEVVDDSRVLLQALIKELGGNVGGAIYDVYGKNKEYYERWEKIQPTFQPLVDYYRTELNKLKEELHADQTIKEIQDILNKSFGGLITAIIEIAKKSVEHLEEIRKELADLVAKLKEAIDKTHPKLQESAKRVSEAIVAIVDSAGKLANAYVDAVIKIVNEHQKEIEDILSVVTELVQDIAKIIFKGATQIEKEFSDFSKLLVQQTKALPIYEKAKKAYQDAIDYKIPDYILTPIEDFCNGIKNILPTQELKDLFTSVYSYVLKHVKRQNVDDKTEVKKIYSQTLTAIRSLLALVKSHVTAENVMAFLETQFPVDASYLRKIPGIAAIRFSVVKLLINHELPSPYDIYYTYRPVLHIEDSIPPAKKFGYFGDGGYFITFDGKHVVFPGTCNYVLAQDIQDGNFSIVGEYVNGNLVSVTVTEPSEFITVKNNGQVLVNNKPSEYPASTKNLDAYVTTPLRRIRSKYGVVVVCKIEPSMSCYAKVSGFYHAKVRGLLGDANNEPYDDFTLPSGKVATSASEFGNAYKLNPSCGAASAKEAEAPHAADCTKYFSGKSSLSSCFNYLDPKNYRESCDQLVAGGIKDSACAVASFYASACLVKNVVVSLPNECFQCKVGSGVINGGDEFSVKIPEKMADIIFVVEQDVDNEKVFKNLVKPVMNELRTELKQHGITDVFIGLIGYGENLQWPRYYTSNNNVNIEGGDVSQMTFTSAHDPIITFKEFKEDTKGEKKLKFLKQKFDVELGTFKVSDAYEAAVKYPFRTAAAKAVVGVISQPCVKSPLSPFSLQDYRLLMARNTYNKLGLTYFHVSPLADLEIAGKPQKTAVGYDKNFVYTFADSKKKPLEGNADFKKDLVLTKKDVCAGFAVNTGGAAFSTSNFLEAKPTQQSQYLKVFARRIAEGLSDTKIEQDCVCTSETGYMWSAQVAPRPRCKVVSRTDNEVNTFCDGCLKVTKLHGISKLIKNIFFQRHKAKP
ncbi:hypothetical protein QAD02_023024 [Eretmocerus hayati]|uniref:Uncharacterized protein n=1 Tax=Eretmocerus hayati TaxID=131215 RepID=A0ACC2PUW8_9HYME|nr:hypothetical protein QAD02_023024 [Eretmocerus hayati]